MRHTWSHILIVISFVASIWGVNSGAYASSRAWLLDGDGRALKIDLTRNAILAGALVGGPTLVDDVAFDSERGYLFIPYGRDPFSVDVHEVKTLQRKGQLSFLIKEAPSDEGETIRFIFPRGGSVIFARIWNQGTREEEGVFELLTIDTQNLQVTSRKIVTPPLQARLMVAPGRPQVYSLMDDKPARADTFDLPSFIWRGSFDLERFINPRAYGRGIRDLGEGKILIVENEKLRREDANSFTLFVVNLSTGQVGPKVRTGRIGMGTLLPKSDRIIFAEQKIVSHPLTRTAHAASTGVLQIFDAVAGNRLTTISIPGVQDGSVLAVSPNEDVLYYQSFEGIGTNARLWSINLRTYSVITQLALPFRTWRMLLFDE